MGTKASNKRERELLPHYNSLNNNILIQRPNVSDKYADFKVIDLLTGKNSWLEDKSHKGDRLMNVGAKYFNGSWIFNGNSNKFTKQITPLLNEAAKDFIEEFNVTIFDGNKDQLFIDLLNAQRNGRKVAITDKIHISNMGELISDYYNNSKAEPCHYIQMGDNFYLLGSDNPLELSKDIPLLKGEGFFSLRFCINNIKGVAKSVRTKPEVMFNHKLLKDSPYSMMEGTEKINPFK